jgi:hypothetical protein
METSAAAGGSAASAWIAVTLATALTVGFISVRCLVFSDLRRRINAIAVVAAMLIFVVLVGRARGGSLGHIIFLYSVVMTFALVESSGGLYLVRKYRREKGVQNHVDTEWYVNSRRKIILLAAGVSLALLFTQDLPIW